MILAGQRSVDQLTNGCCVADVIDDNGQWHLSAALSVNLIGQVGQIQLQLLSKQRLKVRVWLL